MSEHTSDRVQLNREVLPDLAALRDAVVEAAVAHRRAQLAIANVEAGIVDGRWWDILSDEEERMTAAIDAYLAAKGEA